MRRIVLRLWRGRKGRFVSVWSVGAEHSVLAFAVLVGGGARECQHVRYCPQHDKYACSGRGDYQCARSEKFGPDELVDELRDTCRRPVEKDGEYESGGTADCGEYAGFGDDVTQRIPRRHAGKAENVEFADTFRCGDNDEVDQSDDGYGVDDNGEYGKQGGCVKPVAAFRGEVTAALVEGGGVGVDQISQPRERIFVAVKEDEGSAVGQFAADGKFARADKDRHIPGRHRIVYADDGEGAVGKDRLAGVLGDAQTDAVADVYAEFVGDVR